MLSGGLGAGKTTFTRGALRGLGFQGEVTSPTFTYLHLYPTPEGNVAHFDLYRLSRADEFYRMGWEEVIESSRLTLIEWPERLEGWRPDSSWNLQLLVSGSQRQLLQLSEGH